MTGSAWGWRVLINYMVLLALLMGVLIALYIAYEAAGIQTLDSYAEAKRAAKAAGQAMPVPTAQEMWRMTFASAFATFVEYVFTGIAAFGIVMTLVKCIKGEAEGWFSAAFGGFRRPLELFWLTVFMFINILIRLLLLIVPGIVAAFAYSLAWYVKAENPELGAGECLKRSRALMKGRKLALFFFGLSYFGWALLALFPIFAANIFAAVAKSVNGLAFVASLAMALALAVSLAMIMFVSVYAMIGQAVFYRDAKAEAGE